jgi:hypothetical protein
MIDWYIPWIGLGFEALGNLLTQDPSTGAFCHGDAPDAFTAAYPRRQLDAP